MTDNGLKLHLPSSTCELGYPREQTEDILRDHGRSSDEFDRWMYGQTGAICEGRLYDHDKREYYETGCGPHGFVVYGHDLRRFLLRLPVVD